MEEKEETMIKFKAPYFEFFTEYYDALKFLSYEQIGRITMALAAEKFGDNDHVKAISLTAEEQAIFSLIKALGDLSDKFNHIFNL